MANLFTRIKNMVYSGSGGGVGGGSRGTIWQRPDVADHAAIIRKKGGFQETELASIAMRWRANSVCQAEFKFQKAVTESTFKDMPLHPLADLITEPNEYHTQRDLLQATDISLSISGNAYWIKERNNAGVPVKLHWVPSYNIFAFWDPDGKEFISGYCYTVNGKQYLFYPEDVIHFRDVMDNANPRYGQPPLRPFLASICADMSMSEYEDTIVKNMGIPGAVFVPKPENALAISSDVAEKIKRMYKDRVTGVNRGEPLVLDYPADVVFPRVTPQNMAITDMRENPVARIPAALGLNATAVGIDQSQSGLNSSKKEFIVQAWHYGVTPIHKIITSTLQKNLVPEFVNRHRYQFFFDYSLITFLQEDKALVNAMHRADFLAGGITLNEYRAAIGKTPDLTDKGEKYYNELVENGNNNINNQQSKDTGVSNGNN
jgi:HK97 family phage portal protein